MNNYIIYLLLNLYEIYLIYEYTEMQDMFKKNT